MIESTLHVCTANKATYVNTQPERQDRLTLVHIFSGALWLPFTLSLCFFRALRVACKWSGFTPVCKHISKGTQGTVCKIL